MKAHLHRHRGRYLLGILMAIAIGAGYSFGYEETNAQFVQVERGSIAQEVVVTGATKPMEEVELGFERGGRISRVDAPVSARVAAGAALVALESADLAAAKLEAEARLDAARARLAEMRRGPRPEEVRIGEVRVANAAAALADAQQNLLDKLQSAFAKSDDAIRNAVDQLFSNPRSADPQITIATFPERTSREAERVVVEHMLVAWEQSLAGLNASGDLDAAAQAGRENLLAVSQFLDRIASGVNALTVSAALSYRSEIAAARASVSAETAALTAAGEKLRAARASLTLAEEELRLTRAGASIEEIQAQEARVKEAEANVRARAAEIGKTVLRAPFAGTVVSQEAKVGEIVAAGTPLVTLVGATALEIEANVPEVDIGRIAAGNPVAITVDAFPGEEFSGAISLIEPAETIVDGVVNFKVKVALAAQDPRLRNGLTANLTIRTLEKANVLVIPQFAVVETDEGTFVEKYGNGETARVAVRVGIRSQDGKVEVASGLREGDWVVNVGAKTGD